MVKLPESVKKYFWEIEPDELDVSKKRLYVIVRLLDFGDDEAIAWLFRFYDRDEILTALKTTRNLSRYSAKKWAVYFNLPYDEIKVLDGSLHGFWPY